jgi:CheY-like chemotaxis protein
VAGAFQPPSLILLDLAMPKMNGWEFLQLKTADPTIAGIPTIVLSGSPSELPAGRETCWPNLWILKGYWPSSTSIADLRGLRRIELIGFPAGAQGLPGAELSYFNHRIAFH